MTRSTRYIRGVLLGVVLFFAFANGAFGATEIIRNFASDIQIEKDGRMIVTETIVYDFGSNDRHGIFRDVPLTAKNGPRLAIRVSEVKDAEGREYPFTTSAKNGIFRVKIGDPDIFISGEKTYVITFVVQNAIREFADHDELYWNVTGNEWQVEIEQASAVLRFPEEVASGTAMCFTGEIGSTQTDCAASSTFPDPSYVALRSLPAKNGLTIVASFGPELLQVVNVPGTTSNDLGPIVLLSFVLPLLLIIGIIVKMVLRGFNIILPKELRNQPIVVQYDPPKDLFPIDIGAIHDGILDTADLGSVIIDLAVKGYLKIKYLEKNEYEFIKIENSNSLTHPTYRATYDYLFKNREHVTVSELQAAKAPFDRTTAVEELKTYLKEKDILRTSGKKTTTKQKVYGYIGIFVALGLGYLLAFLLFSGGGVQVPALMLVAAIFSFISTIFLAILIHAKLPYGNLSPFGVTVLGTVLGFREFLWLTDREKLRLLNAPELKPETFEKYLPYAMALRVEKQWAKKFESLYLAPPAWFEGSPGSFNTVLFANQIHGLNQSFGQATGAYSSGSSGGFSGGGSGGGGGGSW